MHDGGWRRLDRELRERPAIGDQHQDEHQHVPKAEAVECRRDALRRVNGKRIERPGNGDRCASMQGEKITDEQQRGGEQNEPAGQRDDHPRTPTRDDRIGVVEIGDAPPLALQSEPAMARS